MKKNIIISVLIWVTISVTIFSGCNGTGTCNSVPITDGDGIIQIKNDVDLFEEDIDNDEDRPIVLNTYEQTFSEEIKSDDPAWLMNGGEIINGVYTSPKGGVYNLSFKKQASGRNVVTIKFQLLSSQKDKSDWMTPYIGLRLSSYSNDATVNEGVWLAFKDNKIGIRTTDWPETTHMTIPYNFKDMREVVIEDNHDIGEINISIADDNGVLKPAAVVKIKGNAVNLYAPTDLENSKASTKTSSNIIKGGYINFWIHHCDNAVFDNISITLDEFVWSEYVESDPFRIRDIYSDTWVSTDELNRKTPVYPEVNIPKDRKAGIFYLMWHNTSHPGDGKIYDHSKAYAEGGTEKLKEVMQQGPVGFAHYWAEPYFGYYRSDDEWIIRKHANMLVDAGIDFVFLDVTNGLSYPDMYEKLFEVYRQIRQEGGKTPQVMFFTGIIPSNSAKVINELWDNLFRPQRYKELWFTWEDKPVVLVPPGATNLLSDEVRDFFTWRLSWANTKDSWYTDTNGNGTWPWADMYPQGKGKSTAGVFEQMPVMCGYWANGSYGTNAGRSFSNGKQPPNLTDDDFGFSLTDISSGKGLAYDEQYKYAIKNDPKVVMITGWNEWWAGRWDNILPGGENPAQGQRIANTYIVDKNDPFRRNYFVDCFNPEFSRDLEPMKGGFTDNYYNQTVQLTREFKGARPIPAAFGQKTINILQSFTQWNEVGPEYRDSTGDTMHRDFKSYVGDITYTNATGRNDIKTAKVSNDKRKWYFYAACVSDITAPEGTNWMNLYIDTDQNSSTGWKGYDFIVNRSQKDGKVSIEKNVGGQWKWKTVGEGHYRVNGNQIHIEIPKKLLKVNEKKGFDFKWADNSVADGDVMQFYDLGDCAPNARFNYRYTNTSIDITPSGELARILSNGAIAMKLNSYMAFVDGKHELVVKSDTRQCPLGAKKIAYVPAAFVEERSGKAVDKADVIMLNGLPYVEANKAAKLLGKQLVVSKSGILVFSDRKDISNELMEELLRIL